MKTRESNFELLRIIAMFAIIAYHLLLFFVCVESDFVAYRALQLPLHIGVILFVLISGYYGIRPSLRGFCKLMLPVIFYYVIVESSVNFYRHDLGGGFNARLFLSSSPYWYVRTYLWLFLLAPVINHYLKDMTMTQRVYLLFVLGVASMYFGTVKGDSSLEHGTNVVNFIFLYSIGNTIATYQNEIKVKTKWFIVAYILFNAIIVMAYIAFADSVLLAVVLKLCYFYCSPGLIFNAVLLFMIFTRIHFYNSFVNRVASSTYSMYIIHHIPVLLYGLIGPVVLSLCLLDNHLQTMMIVGLSAIIIMFVSFIVDQSFKPLFTYITDKVLDTLPRVSDIIYNANAR